MSIREQLASGNFGKSEQINMDISFDWNVPEDNAFVMKTRTRLNRMEKSSRAREQRHLLRSIKQKRHQLGYSDNA